MVVEKEEEGEEKVVSVIRDGSKKKNSKEKKRERKETETEEKNYSFNTLTETDHAPLQM